MELLIAGLLPTILTVAGTLVSGLVPWGFVLAKKYIATKTTNALVENAMTRISHTVETVVASLTQTMATSMKAKAADGQLTKEEASTLRSEAIDAIKQQLPIAIQENAKLGVNDLDAFIKTKIEQAVLNQKSKLTPAVSTIVSTVAGA